MNNTIKITFDYDLTPIIESIKENMGCLGDNIKNKKQYIKALKDFIDWEIGDLYEYTGYDSYYEKDGILDKITEKILTIYPYKVYYDYVKRGNKNE